jgi:hypothetical protein
MSHLQDPQRADLFSALEAHVVRVACEDGGMDIVSIHHNAKIGYAIVSSICCLFFVVVSLVGTSLFSEDVAARPQLAPHTPIESIPEFYYFGSLPLWGYNWWYAEWCVAYIQGDYTWAYISDGTLSLDAAWEVHRQSDNAQVYDIYADGTEGWAVSYEVRNPSGTVVWSGNFEYYDSVNDLFNWMPFNYVSFRMPTGGPYGSWQVTYHWQIWSDSYNYYFSYDETGIVTWKEVPSAPLNLQAVSSSSTQIHLAWSAPASDGGASITNYKIYRGTSPGGESPTPLVTIGNQLYYDDRGLTPGITYYYKVSAVNSVGEGSKSNEASATVPIPEFGSLVVPVIGSVALVWVLTLRKKKEV